MRVSIRPTQGHHIESIGKIRRPSAVGGTSVHIGMIRNTYRLGLELSVGVLVVRSFVDGDDGVEESLQLWR